MHYCAAWTDSGFFLTCDDSHSTIGEATECIPCAGGYVVAIENGIMRALTPKEDAEFQSIVHSPISPAPLAINPPSSSSPALAVGETLLEFVLRLMSAYGFGSEKGSEIQPGRVHSADVPSISDHRDARAGCGGDEQKPKVA
jgi:hypothetical protein